MMGSTYRAIRPFVIRDINEALRRGAVSPASLSGGGGGMSAHALFGPYHTGTLDDSQAPQFLKTDGSRALTGNLPVNVGVTIDGVDLSDHRGQHLVGGTDPIVLAQAAEPTGVPGIFWIDTDEVV